MNRKLAYSFGAVATALSYQSFSTYIIFFYVDIMKLPVYLAGIAMAIYAVWNGINDPLAGYISDNTRTRWGRRIPYLAAGAIPFGLVFFLLWVPPFGRIDQVFLLFLYFLFMICLFDGFYTVTILNWASLYPEMYPSLAERTQVNAYRQGFGMIGLLIGIALPPLIYGAWGWGWMGVFFGALISIALLIAVWGSREKKEFSRDRSLPLLPALKATFQNRSFMTFAFANLFVQYAFTLILATIPFFAKYVLLATPQQTTLILSSAFIVAMPMLFVWRRLTLRFGAKKCFMLSMAALAVCLLPLLFTRSFETAMLSSALIGCGLAGFILVSDVIISDVIDEDETNTGVRREGMFFGVNAFITRFAIGMEAVSMSSVFILNQYNPYIFSQSQAYLSGLRFLIVGFPLIALVFGFVIMLWYPLAGNGLEEMKSRLAEIHLKKGVV